MSGLPITIQKTYVSESGRLVKIIKLLHLGMYIRHENRALYLGSDHKLYTNNGFGLIEHTEDGIGQVPDNLVSEYVIPSEFHQEPHHHHELQFLSRLQ